MIENRTLLIRADANAVIGSGHVMRCLALAQSWMASGGVVYLVSAFLPEGLAYRLTADGLRLSHVDVAAGSTADAKATIELASRHGSGWLVVDGYHFGWGYQQAIKAHGLRLLAIDDFGHAERYVADWVLNQNIYATVDLYPHRSEQTDLLLGTHYALLRREFWRWQGWQRPVTATANRILVTLGGGDASNMTRQIVEALKSAVHSSMEVVLVVGGSNPHWAELEDAVRDDPRLRLARSVDDMAELMAWADLAISAAGSTCWELAFMGLPALLIVTAENQRPVAEELDRAGICVNLGWFHELTDHQILSQFDSLLSDEKRRQVMSTSGRELVDGLGAQRVVRHLLESEQHFPAIAKDLPV